MHCSNSWHSTISDDSSDDRRCGPTQALFGGLLDAHLLHYTYQSGLLAGCLVDHSAKCCAFSSMPSSPAAHMAAEQSRVGSGRGGECAIGGDGVCGWGGGEGGNCGAAMLIESLHIGMS